VAGVATEDAGCRCERHPDGSVRPLAALPGKTEIFCPAQDEATAVLLVAGQSNAANSQGQRYQSPDDRVVNFSEGHCYRAASPLLGADDRNGESWPLLGLKLIRTDLQTLGLSGVFLAPVFSIG
jgi:hypothetical protein